MLLQLVEANSLCLEQLAPANEFPCFCGFLQNFSTEFAACLKTS